MSTHKFRGPGGVDLFYRSDDFTDPWVNAPTIILAHGLPRNSNMWYAWVPQLARQFRVVRPDLRGLGFSKVPAETFQNSVDSLVLDAVSLLDHLNVRKAIWIGEATGAVTGLHMAVRVPERLHCLVVMTMPVDMDSSPIVHPDTESEGTTGRHSNIVPYSQEGLEFMRTRGMRSWAREMVHIRPLMREASSGYVEWYIDQIAQNDPRLVAEFFRPLRNADFRSLLKNISVPTLYLDGDRDSYLNSERRRMFEQLPQTRIKTIDGPGTDIGYARPDACVAQVQGFLRELEILPS